MTCWVSSSDRGQGWCGPMMPLHHCTLHTLSVKHQFTWAHSKMYPKVWNNLTSNWNEWDMLNTSFKFSCQRSLATNWQLAALAVCYFLRGQQIDKLSDAKIARRRAINQAQANLISILGTRLTIICNQSIDSFHTVSCKKWILYETALIAWSTQFSGAVPFLIPRAAQFS